jgi:hypothetical protein
MRKCVHEKNTRESDRFKYKMCFISNTMIEMYNIMFEMDNRGGSL